jgi:hypothetical protein
LPQQHKPNAQNPTATAYQASQVASDIERHGAKVTDSNLGYSSTDAPKLMGL